MVTSINVEVTEPCNEGTGRNMYTTYLVKGPNTLVRRRYSDFQWLYQRLQTELPGSIIPIIPHKMALNNKIKFDPNFIEERRQNLEHFIKLIVEHPELQRAPSMTPFMITALGVPFDTAKQQLENTKPNQPLNDPESTDASVLGGDPTSPTTNSKAKKGFSNFVARLKVMTVGTQKLMHTADEDKFNAIQQYVTQMETSVIQLHATSAAISKVTETTGKAVGSLQAPLTGWQEAFNNFNNRSDVINNTKDSNNNYNTGSGNNKEGGDGSEGNKDGNDDDSEKMNDEQFDDMLSAIVEFSNDYTKLMECKYDEEINKFDISIQQLTLLVKSYSNALKQRKQWQVTYTSKFQQIIDKDAALEKATKSLKPPEITNKLAYERDVLKKEAENAKTTLEDCTQRILRETTRIQPILNLKLKNCFKLYTQIQVSYQQRINMAWSQLLPYVGLDPTAPAPSSAPPPPPPQTPPAPAEAK